MPAPITTTPRRWADFLYPALDAATVLASLALVSWVAGRDFDERRLAMGMVSVVVFLLTSQLTGLHRRGDLRSPDSELSRIAVTWTLTILVLALLGFITRGGVYYSRGLVALWAALAPALISLQRMCCRVLEQGFLQRGIGVRRVAIAGLNDLGRQTYTSIQQHPSLALSVVGFYDDRRRPRDEGEPQDASMASVPDPIGSLNDLVDACQSGCVDTVLITLPMRAEQRIKWLLERLSDSTASVYIVPDFFVFELLHARWADLGGLPAVSVFESPLFGVDGMVKRLADLTFALVALVLAAMPMLLIAIAIKATSRGPVFFRQRRYGLDGKEIQVWKFRSMRTCDNGAVVKQASKEDPRVTTVGKILRRSSLDELPQLFNVIEGSMSMVGPRPHATAHNEQYRSLIRGYMLRHKVKPGITGLAQVNGCRGETETLEKMERRVQWDHRYIRRWSLWLDLKILFRTVAVVWKQEQAY